ncbi:C40 family peptidase [Paenibacillus sp. GCM10027627]|uniref:C40 family peptidase n=1 Tax=unclassified Paenibacillus TaxID=185978 RepID=UPI003624D96F
MKKKVSAILAGLALLLAFQVGSVFASASKMDGIIDGLIGIDYNYGGTTTKGFDCSGFTGYVFNKMNIDLPRRSVDQAGVGNKVAKAEMQPGDLVFFDTSGKNDGGISHVGIYVGNGSFAHSSTSKGVTIDKVDSSYYKSRFVTARRVMDEKQFNTYTQASE